MNYALVVMAWIAKKKWTFDIKTNTKGHVYVAATKYRHVLGDGPLLELPRIICEVVLECKEGGI